MTARSSRHSSGLILLGASAIGLTIARIDSRPTWDDTGISAGAVLLAAALFAAIRPARPWVWGLAVGGWLPLLGVLRGGNIGSLIGLAIAFIGAYAGAVVRHAVEPR